MEQLAPPARRVTEEEYLRQEDAAQEKHEFIHGEIVAMAGATAVHVGIATNLIYQITRRLDGKPCKPYGSDLRVRIDESGSYRYPDVTVICGPIEYANSDRPMAITNPKVIIEVTSPSTEANDRGEKFSDYRLINSLEEYFLVSQDRHRVETFYRQSDGIWAIGPWIIQLDHMVKFRSLGIEIPLADIYAAVELPTDPAKTKPA